MKTKTMQMRMNARLTWKTRMMNDDVVDDDDDDDDRTSKEDEVVDSRKVGRGDDSNKIFKLLKVRLENKKYKSQK